MSEPLVGRRSLPCAVRGSIALLALVGSLACSFSDSAVHAPQRVSPDQLLLDLSMLPEGWRVRFAPHTTGEHIGQVADRRVVFRLEEPLVGPLIVQTVYCFAQETGAAAAYRLEMAGQFGSALRLSPWDTPPGQSLQNSIADQYRLECATFSDPLWGGQTVRCKLMAQYDTCLEA
jgi:hypothetical protein